MNPPNRKPNRLANYDYGACGAYFVTICTVDRRPLLRDVAAVGSRLPAIPELTYCGQMVQAAVEQLAAHYTGVHVDQYCIMPDHVHMILGIEKPQNGRMISAPTVSTVVGSMKRWVSRQLGTPVWQKSFYDRVIRNQQEYADIWNYIDGNLLKWMEDIAP